MERNLETLDHHITQQSRRNKLRFISEHPLQAKPISSHDQNPFNFTYFSSSSQSQSTYPHHHHHHQNLIHYCNDPAENSCLLQEGLSLSLSMQQEHHHHHHHQDSGCSSVPGDCPRQMMTMRSTSSSCSCHHPLGPFIGYAMVLKHSRFLKPAEQILDEFCGIDHLGVSFESFNDDEDPMVLRDKVDDHQHKWKDLNLPSMLDEMQWRYKRCCQQIQFVVSSFEGVSGLRNASPYIALATQNVRKHFICLKDTILDCLNLNADVSSGRNKSLVKRCDPQIDPSIYRTAGNNYDCKRTFLQFPIWRSQRGLPDHAVALLRAWLFENFLHPYPNDSEKQILAMQTGLSRTQVSNWFINARVRIWKPMVEEVHTLKERRDQSNNELSLTSSKLQTEKAKRRRSDLPQIAAGDKHELSDSSNRDCVRILALARQQAFDIASGTSRASLVSDISLPFED